MLSLALVLQLGSPGASLKVNQWRWFKNNLKTDIVSATVATLRILKRRVAMTQTPAPWLSAMKTSMVPGTMVARLKQNMMPVWKGDCAYDNNDKDDFNEKLWQYEQGCSAFLRMMMIAKVMINEEPWWFLKWCRHPHPSQPLERRSFIPVIAQGCPTQTWSHAWNGIMAGAK